MTRKEKIYQFMKQKEYLPLCLEELMTVLDVPVEDAPLLRELLGELIAEGKIVQTRKKRFLTCESAGLTAGYFQGNERGFGFVTAEPSDLFIPPGAAGGALHGDFVLAQEVRQPGTKRKREGKIIKILERANHTVIGILHRCRNHAFVVPDDRRISQDIYLSNSACMNAKNGDTVVAAIIKFYDNGKNPEGKIIEILGRPSDSDTRIRAAMRRFGIDEQFPKEIQDLHFPETVDEQELSQRKDFRNTLVLTIDGDEAKDFDDAVSLKKNKDGTYLLGVHIADVSHYVQQGSSLDEEAFKRGTSIYLTDQVIPMLPEQLSNHICSLMPDTDRLTLSLEMMIDQKGQVKDYTVTQGVIRSAYRMTYKNVAKTLEDPDFHEYDHLRNHFCCMKELADLLFQKRTLRGSLNFDFPEAEIRLDQTGTPVSIEKEERTVAHRIIEEFMLLANETVAEHLFWLGIPCIYRVHEQPDTEKTDRFLKLAKQFGYSLKGNAEIHPKALQELLDQTRGKREERILSVMLLRSLMKAEYKGENKGHFGLAAPFYCHFTSPIRRYPDLMVHRILKESMSGTMREERKQVWSDIIRRSAGACSAAEQNAEALERDIDDMKKAEYMKQRIGETFEGSVSGITSFGMFVELENTVEGLVRLASIPGDDFQYIEEKMLLLGRRTGRTFRIGDSVTVRVADAKPSLRQIDFVIEEKERTEYHHGHKNNFTKQKSKTRLFHHRNHRGRH